MSRQFAFYRQVSKSSAETIHAAVQDVLAGVSYLRPVPPDLLHMSLLNNNHVARDANTDDMVTDYETFQQRSKSLPESHHPSKQGVVHVYDARAVKKVLALHTSRPGWLCREREWVQNVSGLQEGDLRFQNDHYTPHLTLARIIRERHEGERYLSDYARQIAGAIACGTYITLEPLDFESPESAWTFRPDRTEVLGRSPAPRVAASIAS
jgi:hypothetical protein